MRFAIVQPLLPARVELLFSCFWQPPERHAVRRVEHLRTAMSGDREDGTRLSKTMRAGESATEGCGSKFSELALRVPPLRKVHLAKASDDEAEFQNEVEIQSLKCLLSCSLACLSSTAMSIVLCISLAWLPVPSPAFKILRPALALSATGPGYHGTV